MVKPFYLLDVNLLIALLWPSHSFNAAARAWFVTKGRHGWATCPMTEAGFARITSNIAFSHDAVAPDEAISILAENAKKSRHAFWPDAISFASAVGLFEGNVIGHQQITDAYLLGLAIHNGGKLATFDRSIAKLLPSASPHSHSIEIVGR